MKSSLIDLLNCLLAESMLKTLSIAKLLYKDGGNVEQLFFLIKEKFL